MKQFLDADFMLHNETGKQLYHQVAAEMPICDYHCHVVPKQIWEDTAYDNITQVWLYGDHYKWRVMRSMGIDEAYITGNKSDYERFLAFAKVLPYCLGNPMYHWCHMELKTYFGITEELNEQSAPAIWEKTCEILRNGLTVRKIIEMSNVAVICTTDDPIDSLEYHRAIREEGKMKTKVLPAFRPDKALNPTAEYLQKLSAAAGIEIKDMTSLYAALDARMDFFAENGCSVSDHGFAAPPYAIGTEAELAQALQMLLKDEKPEAKLLEKYQTAVLLHLGREYAKRGWVMQFHMAAMRNNNTRMFRAIGPDTGFDSINDCAIGEPLSRLLDALEVTDELPRTILYSLNPRDNYLLGAMIGNFQSGTPGKIQLGSGWWFNDQRDGMIDQMKTLANLGLLSQFVGMLTDSRSFLSYTRHDYFRRIFCNLIGQWVEDGEYPANMARLTEMVKGVCYENAARYFRF